MYCPTCKGENLRVLEKRDTEGETIRRRRECVACGFRFTTYERLEVPSLAVIKKDGHKEVYSREKMGAGIYKACEKRPIEEPEIERLIDDIEKELKGCSTNEVSSEKIGNLVMEKLMAVDEVAYLRFASVYKSFETAASFAKEVEELSQ